MHGEWFFIKDCFILGEGRSVKHPIPLNSHKPSSGSISGFTLKRKNHKGSAVSEISRYTHTHTNKHPVAFLIINIQFSSSIVLMDISLPGCYTRFSCTLIKWCSQQAKITIHPIPSPPPGLTNWPINEVYISKILPVHISTYILYALLYSLFKIFSWVFFSVLKIEFW